MTRLISRAIATALSALALGLLPASMVAVAVFADGQSAERWVLLLVIALGYSCLGFLAGWLSASWRAALWISLPALPALLVFGDDMTFALMYFALIGVCTMLGGAAGAMRPVRRRRGRL
jgi:hypothetical protein